MHSSHPNSDPLNPLSPITNLSISESSLPSPPATPTSPHRILIVGGAYAGISAVLNLLDLQDGKQDRPAAYKLPKFEGRTSKRGVEITVVDERDGFFHSVGAPLAHISKPHTTQMWKRFSHLQELHHQSLTFHQGSITRIDPETCTATYTPTGKSINKPLEYDYMILATGLRRHWPAVPKSGKYTDYVKEAHDFIDSITGSKPSVERRVVVIGAGAVGIEFAAEIAHNHPSLTVSLIHSRSELLSSEPLPSEVKSRAKLLLEAEGVDVILQNRASVTNLPDGKFLVRLADGREIVADVVLDTTKKGSATTGCLPLDCVDEHGEVLVTPELTFPDAVANSQRHFAAGDVVRWSGIKRAGGAMVMGQVAATNLFAAVLNEEDVQEKKFAAGRLPEFPVVIGLAVGKQCLTFNGTEVAYGEQLLKDYFQDDLGWSASLKYLGLSDVEEVKVGKDMTKTVVTEVITDVDSEPVAITA